jgi:hypothetical protein
MTCHDDGYSDRSTLRNCATHLQNPLSPDLNPPSPDLPMTWFESDESASPLLGRGSSWLNGVTLQMCICHPFINHVGFLEGLQTSRRILP